MALQGAQGAVSVTVNTLPRHRILFLAQEFVAGGAAFLALRHMQRLVPAYDIDLLVTGPCADEMLRQLPQQVSVFTLDAQSWRADVNALWCLDLVMAARALPPFQHAYHALLATSVFPSRRACLAMSLVQARRKLLFLVDERLAQYPQRLLPERCAIECTLLSADLVLPVSARLWQHIAQQCPMLARRPWQVLHPPVELARIEAHADVERDISGPPWLGSERPVVLTVARLSTEKQILQCLRIHHRLRQDGVDFDWYVLGEGPEQARLQDEIEALRMSDVFFLSGVRSNVVPWMLQCTVFALFSASEGCPTVVIEALTLGCPVIVTDVNGVDELIDNGRTGIIVPNEMSAMATELSRLLLDGSLRAQFRCALASDPPVSDPAQERASLIAQIEVAAPTAPIVSILIPTYNQAQYIGQAIRSALMQDFASLEVLVIDDASTDQTAVLAQQWDSDPRFRYICNERNLGRVANYRRALVEHARGEWVLMLDGDDYLTDADFISHAWKALQRHAGRSVVFAQAGHRATYLSGTRPDVNILPPIIGAEQLMSGAQYLKFVYETGFFTHLGTLYHRCAAIANGCYTADISSSDMDSFLRLALEGEVLVLNTIAGCWVQHGANACRHVPLNKISANVRIFRQIALTAVQRGLISKAHIEGPLNRYEARTFAYLFGQTLGRAAHGPLAPLRMLAVLLSADPRLLLNRHLLSVCLRHLPSVTRLFRHRWMPSLKQGGKSRERRNDVP
jgi:glycosyltransferase involved in cell wall biosynthesis